MGPEHREDNPGQCNGWSLIIPTLRFENHNVFIYIKKSPFCWWWLLCQDIKHRRDEDLLVLPTDAVLFEDSSFKVKPCDDFHWDMHICCKVFFDALHVLCRCMLRNMLRIRKHFSRIMLKLMPNSATLEQNLILQRLVILCLCLLTLQRMLMYINFWALLWVDTLDVIQCLVKPTCSL